MSGSLNHDPRGNAAADESRPDESRPDESLPASGAAHPPVPDRLLRAVARASGIPWSATDEFRDALSEYVHALRGDGLDVVQTIIAVKAAVAYVPPSLLEQAVKWSIEQYYLPALHTPNASGGRPSASGRNSSVT